MGAFRIQGGCPAWRGESRQSEVPRCGALPRTAPCDIARELSSLSAACSACDSPCFPPFSQERREIQMLARCENNGCSPYANRPSQTGGYSSVRAVRSGSAGGVSLSAIPQLCGRRETITRMRSEGLPREGDRSTAHILATLPIQPLDRKTRRCMLPAHCFSPAIPGRLGNLLQQSDHNGRKMRARGNRSDGESTKRPERRRLSNPDTLPLSTPSV
jgi:hypothetical protein